MRQFKWRKELETHYPCDWLEAGTDWRTLEFDYQAQGETRFVMLLFRVKGQVDIDAVTFQRVE